jgi:hypothetical protein
LKYRCNSYNSYYPAVVTMLAEGSPTAGSPKPPQSNGGREGGDPFPLHLPSSYTHFIGNIYFCTSVATKQAMVKTHMYKVHPHQEQITSYAVKKIASYK